MAYEIPGGSVVQELDANMDMHSFPPVADLTQYDATMPILAVRLWAGQEAYRVPESAYVSVRVRKPDGKTVYDPALGLSEDRQTVYIGVTQQMTMAAGEGKAVVEVMDGGKVACSGRLTLSIAENPVPEAAFESEDEFQTLGELAGMARESQEAAKKSEDAAKKSEDAAKASEGAAQAAQRLAEAAQSAAEDARDRAGEAKSGAEAALEGAQAASGLAEGYRDEAGEKAEEAGTKAEEAATQAGLAAGSAQAAEGSAGKAAQSAQEAQDWTNQSRSWAVGEGYPDREDEQTNNSKYWAGQAQSSAESTGESAQLLTDNLASIQGAAQAATDAASAKDQAEAAAREAEAAAQSLQDTITQAQGMLEEFRQLQAQVQADIEGARSHAWDVAVEAADWEDYAGGSFAGITSACRAVKEADGMTPETDVSGIAFTGGDRNAAAAWAWLEPGDGQVTLYAQAKPSAAFSVRLTEAK